MTREPKTIVITGASDGIGKAAARQLAANGHHVVIVGRSEHKTKAVAAQLNAPYYIADFADLQQVHVLAHKLQTDYPRIDVLVNNAGGIMGARELTRDGFEKTFQVNHLAPFLLTTELMPALIKSMATVIQTASVAARRYGNLNLHDLQNERNYSPQKAYGDSKLANILFTKELQRRYGSKGISVVAFHPGYVLTNFANDTPHFMRYLYHLPIIKNLFGISAEKGSETLVWLAEEAPGEVWQPGAFYEKKTIVSKVNPQINNSKLAQELWDASETLLTTTSVMPQ